MSGILSAMAIEFEATFPNVKKDQIREVLKKIGATCIKSEFMQKRTVFTLPQGHEITGGWLRVRDEGDKITMSLKVIDGDKIEDQKEINLKVDSYENARSLLNVMGCTEKAYQESKRELWSLDGVEITIDEWPFLEPFVEIEGKSEQSVRMMSEKMGFAYKKALFCSVATLYHMKYGVTEDEINNKTPLLVFGGTNPFLSN
jgi:adenylate cyclase class 2